MKLFFNSFFPLIVLYLLQFKVKCSSLKIVILLQNISFSTSQTLLYFIFVSDIIFPQIRQEYLIPGETIVRQQIDAKV